MTYRITGLEPADFSALFAMSDADLASRNARRVTAQASSGYPCRISLEDAGEGEELILLNYTNHDVETPYRSSFAIYVRKDVDAADYVNSTPPVFEGRALGLRGFDAEGELLDARLALPGEAEACICDLLDNPSVAYIHAHNAAHGCFAARIDRHGDRP